MIPEKNKRPGVCYAFTADGVELPVINVTLPEFAENTNRQKLDSLSKDFVRFQKSPAFVRRFFSRHSILMRGMDSASGTFLDGMTTYLAKLGPGMLGKGYSGLIDRKGAGGFGPVSFRMRLRDTAHLMAEEMAPALASRTGGAIRLLNIGGGPAIDSLNALILLQKAHPEWLHGRRISIRVLDVDMAGPSFGSCALAALLAEGAPLHGLDATFEHVIYNWNDASELERMAREFNADDVVIGSSEGGLFEYGSDRVIADNLKAIRNGTPAKFVIVGSVVRDGETARLTQAKSNMSLRIFALEDFRTLAGSAGWVLGRVMEGNPLYYVISLRKELP